MDLSQLPMESGFRLRGEQVTRLETFVDAAFAFAVTLLVVSFQSMPQSFSELYDALRRLPAFLAGFAILALFWTAHNRFSRRTGLEDAKATLLSLALVAATLFYVYPLRMVMSAAMHFFSGGWAPSEFAVSDFREFRLIFVIYGVGFASLAAITAALNMHALRRGAQLRLDAAECMILRGEVASQLVLVACAALSACIALSIPASDGLLTAMPGLVYALLGILMPMVGAFFGRRANALLALRA
jgi:uncharacterized membrane protein